MCRLSTIFRKECPHEAAGGHYVGAQSSRVVVCEQYQGLCRQTVPLVKDTYTRRQAAPSGGRLRQKRDLSCGFLGGSERLFPGFFD